MSFPNTSTEKVTKSKPDANARDKAIQKGVKDRSRKIDSNSIIKK